MNSQTGAIENVASNDPFALVPGAANQVSLGRNPSVAEAAGVGEPFARGRVSGSNIRSQQQSNGLY
jgi:hypothetical protein